MSNRRQPARQGPHALGAEVAASKDGTIPACAASDAEQAGAG